MTLSQSSGFSFNTPPLKETLPALLTRIPMGPSSLSTLFSAGSNAFALGQIHFDGKRRKTDSL